MAVPMTRRDLLESKPLNVSLQQLPRISKQIRKPKANKPKS